jgi:hypothetical protein
MLEASWPRLGMSWLNASAVPITPRSVEPRRRLVIEARIHASGLVQPLASHMAAGYSKVSARVSLTQLGGTSPQDAHGQIGVHPLRRDRAPSAAFADGREIG